MNFPVKSVVTLSLVSLGIAIVTEQKVVAEKERIQAESFSTSAIQEFFDAVQLEFNAFEADAEKGPDLGLSLVLRSGGDSGTGQAGSSDQSSLRDYCAGKTASSAPKVEAGAKVMADWEDYGAMYPGRIDKVHRNGTSRIKYDDGFTEDRVTPGNVKVIEERENKQNVQKIENDPACKFLELVEKVKPKIQKLSDALAMWCMNKRANIAGNKAKQLPPPPRHLREGGKPALVPAGLAPAPAAVPEEHADEIAALKAQLAENDVYIEELKEKELEQARLLEEYTLDTSKSVKETVNQGVKTVEDLIKEYKDGIVAQEAEIERRTKRIAQQAMELARLGAQQIPLENLLVDATALEDEVTGAWDKMTMMDEEGELDPDLKKILEGVMMPIRNIRGKIGNLMNQEKKTTKLEHRMDEAKKGGGRIAKESKDAAKAVENQVAREELKMLKSAQSMTASFRKSRNEVQELDVGLHPQGAKWWRYRYEHAYIEAWIMICVSILMLIWRKIVQEIKMQLEIWALPAGTSRSDLNASSTIAFYESPGRDDGSLFLVWLTCLSEMMLTCILVFITIWIICKTSLVDLMPFAIKAGDMNAPVTGDQYRKLAIDCSSIYFFAILMYFILIFPIAHDTKRLTHKIAQQFDETLSSPRAELNFVDAVSLGTLARSKTEFLKEEFFFRQSTPRALAERTEKEAVQLREMFGDDWEKFPLTLYLIMSVHMNISSIFEFLWKVWLPFVITFVLFGGLHRFWQMGYIRIMCFFTTLTFLLIFAIGWYTKSIGQAIDQQANELDKVTASRMHQRWQTEMVVLKALQFALFFQCYGVARMIHLPWMWELHFWPVLTLTILAILLGLLFAFMVAPTLPSFCAVMAMPPYLNHQNFRVMLYAVEVDAKEKEQAAVKSAKLGQDKSG